MEEMITYRFKRFGLLDWHQLVIEPFDWTNSRHLCSGYANRSIWNRICEKIRSSSKTRFSLTSSDRSYSIILTCICRISSTVTFNPVALECKMRCVNNLLIRHALDLSIVERRPFVSNDDTELDQQEISYSPWHGAFAEKGIMIVCQSLICRKRKPYIND